MKRFIVVISIFFFTLASVSAQSAVNPLLQIDSIVKSFAGSLHRKLVEEKTQKIAITQFHYRGANTPLGSYWVNQLFEELANIPGKSYSLLTFGATSADHTLTGEIVDVAGAVRVYTRLIRASDRTVVAGLHSDFERNAALLAMLVSSSGASSDIALDEFEPDDWDNPLYYEIGAESSVLVIGRSIHPGDEDFFLLVPATSGQLVMETTGSTDTYMEFYYYETRETLAENDDGGSGSNARIRYNVQAGRRYIAKVRGYSTDTRGNYAFRAYIPAPREGASSWENPITYQVGTDSNATAINRIINEGDEDYFLLVLGSNGRLVAETTGSLDTYMELYNYETREVLEENDDGGSGSNARIRYTVSAGRRYLAKVRGYDSDTSGDYAFRAYISAP